VRVSFFLFLLREERIEVRRRLELYLLIFFRFDVLELIEQIHGDRDEGGCAALGGHIHEGLQKPELQGRGMSADLVRRFA